MILVGEFVTVKHETFPRPCGGDPEVHNGRMGSNRLFPAHAGVILNRNCRRKTEKAFPRQRGGDPKRLIEALVDSDFSPPTRGFYIDNPAQKADNRFILNAERGKVYAVF